MYYELLNHLKAFHFQDSYNNKNVEIRFNVKSPKNMEEKCNPASILGRLDYFVMLRNSVSSVVLSSDYITLLQVEYIYTQYTYQIGLTI